MGLKSQEVLLFLQTCFCEKMLMSQVRFQFSLENENSEAILYLERYLTPQFSRRIVKISFGTDIEKSNELELDAE